MNISSKIDLVKKLLSEGEYLLVHLDPKVAGVHVPPTIRKPALTLKFSYLFNRPTSVDENGIDAELMFNGSYSHCVVPWDAIWGVTNDKGEQTLWPEAMPEIVRKDLQRAALIALKEVTKEVATTPSETPPAVASKIPALEPASEISATRPTAEEAATQRPTKLRGSKSTAAGHLRRVK